MSKFQNSLGNIFPPVYSQDQNNHRAWHDTHRRFVCSSTFNVIYSPGVFTCPKRHVHICARFANLPDLPLNQSTWPRTGQVPKARFELNLSVGLNHPTEKLFSIV